MGNALDAELADVQFMEKWTGGKFTAAQRRILMTKWAADAFDALVKARRMERYFVKTGCLLRVDGKPNAINIQGLPTYTFPVRCSMKLVINIDDSDESSDGDASSDSGSESEDYESSDMEGPADEDFDRDSVDFGNCNTSRQDLTGETSDELQAEVRIVADGVLKLHLLSTDFRNWRLAAANFREIPWSLKLFNCLDKIFCRRVIASQFRLNYPNGPLLKHTHAVPNVKNMQQK